MGGACWDGDVVVEADPQSPFLIIRLSPRSRQNMQNPVPDYYGEKIQSISDYRRWLRDCSVYRRKAAHGLKQDAEALAAAEQQQARQS